jgi:hypothetical protein
VARLRFVAARPERDLVQRPAAQQPHAALGVPHAPPRRRRDQEGRPQVRHPSLEGHPAQVAEVVAHHQVRLGGRRQEARHCRGRVLAVAVDHQDAVRRAGGREQPLEASGERVPLAEVAPQPQHGGPAPAGHLAELRRGVPRHPVVDHQHAADRRDQREQERGIGGREVARDEGRDAIRREAPGAGGRCPELAQKAGASNLSSIGVMSALPAIMTTPPMR